MWWLIAGLNTMPRKTLEKLDLRYIEKQFGRFMVILGVLLIANPIVWTLLEKEEHIGITLIISIVGTVVGMYVFGAINRDKIKKE